ncbi:MAG: hypothetical protein ACRC2S_19990 [Waterburya sp.]
MMQVIINNFSELILFVSVWLNFICHWQEFEVKKSSVSLLKILTSEDIAQYSSTLRSPRTIMSNFASKYFIDLFIRPVLKIEFRSQESGVRIKLFSFLGCE